MQQILVLVDFDNYATLNDVPGQKPKQHHVDRCVEQLISHLTDWSKQHNIHSAEFIIRLYGGWYSSSSIDSRTEVRCMLDAFCNKISKRKGKHRILISLADSPLYFSDITFTYTLREDKTLIKIRQSDLDMCMTQENCKTKIVDDWQKNGCSGCTVDHKNLLRKFNQKNVDTAIVADTIFATIQKVYDSIIIVSADYDMLPGVLFATSQKQQIAIFRRHESVWFDFMLSECEIQHGITPTYR